MRAHRVLRQFVVHCSPVIVRDRAPPWPRILARGGQVEFIHQRLRQRASRLRQEEMLPGAGGCARTGRRLKDITIPRIKPIAAPMPAPTA